MRRGAAVAASSLGLALVLAGCGVVGGTTADRTAAEPVTAGCPAQVTTPGAQSGSAGTWYSTYDLIPSDVEPTAVVRCVQGSETDVQGLWQTVTTEQVTGPDATDLLAALRLEDLPRPLNGSCDAMLTLWPWVGVVLADGRWLPVGIPVDECGHPRAEASTAFDAASWSQVATDRLRLQQTTEQLTNAERAAALGCADAWKDELGLLGEGTGDVPTAVVPAAGPLLLCRYRVDAGTDAGSWVGGQKVTGADADRVRGALIPRTPAAACTATRSEYVVVMGADGTWANVDLACPRVLGTDGAVGALPSSSTDLLASLTS